MRWLPRFEQRGCNVFTVCTMAAVTVPIDMLAIYFYIDTTNFV